MNLFALSLFLGFLLSVVLSVFGYVTGYYRYRKRWGMAHTFRASGLILVGGIFAIYERYLEGNFDLNANEVTYYLTIMVVPGGILFVIASHFMEKIAVAKGHWGPGYKDDKFHVDEWKR